MWLPWRKRPQVDDGSLESLMRRFNDLESSLKDSASAYRNALGSVDKHLPPVALAARDHFRKDLRTISKTVATAIDSRHWSELSGYFDSSMKRYSRDMEAAVRGHEDEAKQVMAMMSVLAESMAARERNYSVRFRDIAKKTRQLVTTQDIALIRQRLSEEMTQLEKYVEDLERDTQQAVARLGTDVKAARERKDSSWDAMPVDPVTDLPGKAMGAGALEVYMKFRTRFGAGIFTVQSYDAIEKQHGIKGGVEILKQIAARLQASFRDPDFLCRWGQAQFLLLSEDNLTQLSTRATNVARLLSSTYSLPAGGAVDVACDFNLVERINERRPEELLERLEAA